MSPRSRSVRGQWGGAVGGFASVGTCRDDDADERTGQLWALYLHPRYWNRGLGRRLHDEARTVLSGRGCHRAVLWVLRTNVRAQRLYQRAGWARDGAVKVDHLRGVALDEVRYAPQPRSGALTEGRFSRNRYESR